MVSKPPKIEKKVLKDPDQFQTRGGAVLEYLARRQKRFVPVVVAALLVVAGVYAYDWWSGNRLEKSWQEYYAATKLAENEKWEKLKAVWGSNKKNRPGFFAAVTLADHYYTEARKEIAKDATKPSTNAPLAVEWYGRALELPDLLLAEKQLLTLNRGNAHELSQKYDDALNDYKAA